MASTFPKRSLGKGLEASAIGYGAMVLAQGMYGEVDDDRSIEVLRHALERGVTFFDTSDAYGADGHNERLLARAFAGRMDEVVIATKFGYVLNPNEEGTPIETNWDIDAKVKGTADFVHRQIDGSLARLGVDQVDLWYLHFPDPAVHIEKTVEAMAEVVQEGKAKHLGVCNVTAEQLRRAVSVHPIAAVQNEYSLWTRNIERGVLPTARELGVGVVPWAPLGSGFLSGQVSAIKVDDFRNRHPRYRGENLERNVDRFAPLRTFAEEKGVTPVQLALAWLLHQGDDIVPIPGTRNPEHLDDNLAALSVTLSEGELKRIDELAPAGLAAGGRCWKLSFVILVKMIEPGSSLSKLLPSSRA